MTMPARLRSHLDLLFRGLRIRFDFVGNPDRHNKEENYEQSGKTRDFFRRPV
jgi:hypothetical protein